MDILSKIRYEIQEERARQDIQFGGANHDDVLPQYCWLGIFTRQIGLAAPNDSRSTVSNEMWERQLIRIAAVAQAALESHYRLHPTEKVVDIREGSGY